MAKPLKYLIKIKKKSIIEKMKIQKRDAYEQEI